MLAEFGTGQVFWSMLWFFLFFIWIWLLIVVFGDIFRSPDLSGWGKALWSIFVIFLPYLGVFVVPHRPRAQDAGARRAGRRSNRTRPCASTSRASPLPAGRRRRDRPPRELRDKGVISEAEFQQAKAKAFADGQEASKKQHAADGQPEPARR